MPEFTVTNADIEALGSKLDGMSDQFDAQERATLQAVWALAGSGLEASTSDVEGFAGGAMDPTNAAPASNWGASFSLNFSAPQTQGILIGLNQGMRGGAGKIGGVVIKGEDQKF